MPSSSHNRFHMKSSRHSIELANADISRLMDPSYHPHTYEPARAYVDHRGEMHDPDFHYFPVYNTSRGRRASDPSSSKSRWEEDEEEEEEEDLQAPYYHRRHSKRHTRSAQHSPARDYPTFPSVSSSPSSLSSPLPSSSPYVSVFEEKPHAHHSLLPKRFRRHSAGSESVPYPSYDDDEYSYSDPIQYDDSSDSEEGVDVVAARDESLHAHHTDLSYSQAMKKQWVAISLSLRFQIFRARRRASRCRKD
jgi:hypothetical protein